MVKNREINGTEEIGLVTPTPGLYPLLDVLYNQKLKFCDRRHG